MRFGKNIIEISTPAPYRLGCEQGLASLDSMWTRQVTVTTLQGLAVSGQHCCHRFESQCCHSRWNRPQPSSWLTRRSSNYFTAEWQVSGSHCAARTPCPGPRRPRTLSSGLAALLSQGSHHTRCSPLSQYHTGDTSLLHPGARLQPKSRRSSTLIITYTRKKYFEVWSTS